ncbi:MAG: hypothetical protein WBH31_11900 [Promethearchaeia archaeon]|jgi:hypothetical protein
MKILKTFKDNIYMNMENQPNKETILKLVKQAIERLCEKNISEVVILSSYKINSVLRENYGIDIRVDRIGRILSSIAERNQLKRLNTNIPKYKLKISTVSSLEFF